MTPLSNATLKDIPQSILRPEYDRTALKPGIVHIGVGNFHRAHQSWYLHRLMQNGAAQNWAIIGAGVRPYDENMRRKLQAQDYLSTLIELDPKGRSAEIVGSMIDYIPVEDGNGALIAKIADPAIRIVALTVTEGGYYIDAASKGFDENHTDMIHDATSPGRPRTAFGAIIAALRLRQTRGIGPLTLQSCDNLQGNGTILRQIIVSLARLSDSNLADWIDNNCSFPNSMVDCIVPATGPREQNLVQELGILDTVPVTHENFRQWVIEDNFCAGRPDWDRVGATFSSDVHAYETMKIRILNGGHQVIAAAAEIMEIETIAQTITHPLIKAFFRKVQHEEILPHVAPVPGTTPQQYLELIETRFANSMIADTTRRVAFDGSSRHPGFIIPSVHDSITKSMPVDGLALVSAAWARYCLGIREDNTIIEPNDPLWPQLQSQAQKARTQPHCWLEMRKIYGNLAENSEFSAAFERWLHMIYAHGIAYTMKTYTKTE